MKLKNKYYNLHGNATLKSILSSVSQIVNKKEKKEKPRTDTTNRQCKTFTKKITKTCFFARDRKITQKTANWEKPKDKVKHLWQKTKTIELKRKKTKADNNNERGKIKEDWWNLVLMRDMEKSRERSRNCEDEVYINKIKQIYVYTLIPFYYFW